MSIELKKALRRLDGFRSTLWVLGHCGRETITESTIVSAERLVQAMANSLRIYPVYSSMESLTKLRINFSVRTKDGKKLKLSVTDSSIFNYVGRNVIIYNEPAEAVRIKALVDFFRKNCAL